MKENILKLFDQYQINTRLSRNEILKANYDFYMPNFGLASSFCGRINGLTSFCQFPENAFNLSYGDYFVICYGSNSGPHVLEKGRIRSCDYICFKSFRLEKQNDGGPDVVVAFQSVHDYYQITFKNIENWGNTATSVRGALKGGLSKPEAHEVNDCWPRVYIIVCLNVRPDTQEGGVVFHYALADKEKTEYFLKLWNSEKGRKPLQEYTPSKDKCSIVINYHSK